MHAFHVSIQSSPRSLDQIHSSRQEIELDGQQSKSVDTLLVSSDKLRDAFPITFDQVAERLGVIDRVFFEPDGSFVWVSPNGGTDWQLDGQLWDGRGQLMSVELKGFAPWSILTRLFATFDWPTHRIIVQDMQRGLFYSTDEFRRCFAE